MFKDGNKYDPGTPTPLPGESQKLSIKDLPKDSPDRSQKSESSPPKPKRRASVRRSSQRDGPGEEILTPENSFIIAKNGIEKEEEIQRNLDIELVKLQTTEIDQDDDEMTRTSKEKEKAQKINAILRSKSESQARVAAA